MIHKTAKGMLLAAVVGTLLLRTAGSRTIRLKLNNAVQPKMANPPPVKSNANERA